jgi:hypothetical protein
MEVDYSSTQICKDIKTKFIIWAQNLWGPTILPPIIMAGDIISKLNRTYVNHIIHVTHAQSFDLVFWGHAYTY